MSQRTFQRIAALAIVAFTIIIIVIIGATLTRDGAETEARNFMSSIQKGDSVSSYSEASPELRTQISAEDWDVFVQRAQDLIVNPELVAKDTRENGNRRLAYENSVSYFNYSIVLELEDKNDGWRVRHIDIQPRKFDTQRFGADPAEVSE